MTVYVLCGADCLDDRQVLAVFDSWDNLVAWVRNNAIYHGWWLYDNGGDCKDCLFAEERVINQRFGYKYLKLNRELTYEPYN